MTNALVVRGAVALLLCSVPLASNAETQPVIEEMTVTGQKIKRTRQQTIESVTLFDADYLERGTEIDDLYDLLDQTPNAASFGTYDYTIRGITSGGQSNQFLSDTIGIFVDGAMTTSRASQRGALSTWDMQQVEILKGPQSTNQGRNSLAGAIVMQTNDPEEAYSGRVRVAYGEDNTQQLAFMQTGSLGYGFSFRISADRRHNDGYVTNPILNDDEFDQETATTVRLKLLKAFDNGAEVLLTLSDLKYDDDGVDNVQDFDPVANLPADPSRRRNFDNDPSTWVTDAVAHTLQISIPINDRWDFTAISAYSDERFKRDNDIDGFNGNAILDLKDEETEITQELRFTYNGERLDASLGLFYADGEYDGDWSTEEFSIPLGPLTPLITFRLLQGEDYTNIAAFGNVDYHVTDKLTLIAGLRVDQDEREGSIDNEVDLLSDLSAFDPVCVGTFGAPCNAFVLGVLSGQLGQAGNGDSDLTEVVSKFGVDYQWQDWLSTGLVYSEGYRPGGTSINPVRATVRDFDAEYTQTLEFSLRSKWFNDRLSFNANIFHTQWDDQQISVNGDLGNFDSDVFNAGESNLSGIEIEGRLALSAEFSVFGSIGWLDTEFDEFMLSSTEDLSGNEFQGAPDITANITIDWQSLRGWFGRLNVTHVGESYLNANNLVEIEDYTLVNFNFGYETDRWSAQLFANNALDEEYVLEQYDRGGGVNDFVYGNERVIGARFEFGW